jgi:hypothetical protein
MEQLTVGQLREVLNNLPDETPVLVLVHENDAPVDSNVYPVVAAEDLENWQTGHGLVVLLNFDGRHAF